MLSACSDASLKVLDLKTFNYKKIIRSAYGNPLCLDVLKGFIAVGFEDDSISIIDMESMEPKARLVGHKSFVT